MTGARSYIDRSELLQIVVANIRDGEKIGAHSSRFTKVIVQRVKRRLADKIADGVVPAVPQYEDILTTLEDICFGVGVPGPNGYVVRPGSHYLMRSEPDCPEGDVWYSSVTTLDIFETLVPEDQWKKLFGPLADKTGNPSYDPLLLSVLTPNWRGSFQVGPNFSFGNPVAWFTPRTELRKAIDGRGSLADAARDRLGLVHRKEPTQLVALHFPESVLAIKQSGRPTFADAGRHRRFMVASVQSPPLYSTAWGQTLALDLFALNAALSDGVKERVFATISATDIGSQKLEVTYLGALTETRGDKLASRTVFAGTDADFAMLQIARDQARYHQLADIL